MDDDENYKNRVLYRMCQKEPRHTDEDVIAGKLLLIGRAYSAAIERGSGHAGNVDKFYEKVAGKIVRSDLDEWLSKVPNRIVTEKTLPSVLAAHFRFVKFLKKHTARARLSFAAKYLHFHRPDAFFIYDSRAVEEIKTRITRRRCKPPSICADYDPENADFVLRCMEYRDKIAIGCAGSLLTPRQLDRKLLGY